MAAVLNEEGSVWSFVIEGRFDKRNGAPDILPKLEDVPANITEIIYDFAGVTHLMNDGLKAINLANGAMNDREGKFSIINATPGIMRVLRMNGLDALAVGADLADLS